MKMTNLAIKEVDFNGDVLMAWEDILIEKLKKSKEGGLKQEKYMNTESTVSVKDRIRDLNNYMIQDYKSIFSKMDEDTIKQLIVLQRMYSNPSFGFIYFLYNNETKLTKIGYSSNLKERFTNIKNNIKASTGKVSSLELRMLYFAHTSALPKLEKQIHLQLDNYKKESEWFDLGVDDVFNSLVPLDSFNVLDVIVSLDEANEESFVDSLPTYNFSEEEVCNHFNVIPYNCLLQSRNELCSIYKYLVNGNKGFKILSDKVVNNQLKYFYTTYSSPIAEESFAVSDFKRKMFYNGDFTKQIYEVISQ